MKALQMLDHVMLWVARIYAIYVVGNGLYQLLFYRALLQQTMQHTPDWAAPAISKLFLLNIVSTIIVGAIFTVGLFLLRSQIARKSLLLTAATTLVLGMWSAGRLLVIVLFYANSVSTRVTDMLLLFCVHVLMNLIIIWVSLHPPQSSKPSDPHSINHHPLPQSC
jgi:hypothetical protein